MTTTAVRPDQTGLLNSLGQPHAAEGRWRTQLARWIRPTVAAAWMNVLIAAVAAVAVTAQGYLPHRSWPASDEWGIGALKLFVLWCVSFLPGWLYVRFLGLRAAALWSEYVLNLHRLGWDHAGHLPAPPRRSEYYARWLAEQPGGLGTSLDSAGHGSDNIYRQKFDAYYGRQVADASIGDRDFRIKVETLFPVFLTTVVLAVGWVGILWDTSFLTTTPDAFGMLKYAFLGAYSFILGMLVRRFYQGDLRPSAYAAAVLRIITVLIMIAALHAALFAHLPATVARGEVAVAFLIGIFPLAGLEALRRLASSTLKEQLPQVDPEYPLNQIDGLNIWYETRLAEEGVEDMQNLATMNLVDVILHTRVPVGRLIDWVDQAFLLIHLEPVSRQDVHAARQASSDMPSCPSAGPEMRVTLRRMGIRTATDLLAVFSRAVSGGRTPADREFVYQRCPIEEDRLRLLVEVLLHEQGLVPVWNWRSNGSPSTRS